MFEGRVCLNGKDLRVYTAARAEIQSTFIAAMDFIRAPVDHTSPSSSAQGLSALALAKKLCESFVAPRVTQMVFGDDETAALRRVATTMTTEYHDVALPLKQFIQSHMKLPLIMHDVVKECLTLPPGVQSRHTTHNSSPWVSKVLVYLPLPLQLLCIYI